MLAVAAADHEVAGFSPAILPNRSLQGILKCHDGLFHGNAIAKRMQGAGGRRVVAAGTRIDGLRGRIGVLRGELRATAATGKTQIGVA